MYNSSIKFSGATALYRNGQGPTSASFTCMAWVRIVVDTNATATFFEMVNDNAGNENAYLATDVDGTTLYCGGTSGSSLTVGRWYHIVLVYDTAATNNNVAYLNGVLDIQTNFTDFTSMNEIRLGGFHDGSPNGSSADFLNGNMCAIKIWDTALTIAEIRNEMLYYAPQKLFRLNSWIPGSVDPNPKTRYGTLTRFSNLGGNRKDLTVIGTTPTIDAGPPIEWAPTRAQSRNLFVKRHSYRLEFRKQGTSTWTAVGT